MIIAIDGPAGSGKSTTARAVAQRLGYLFLDTGAMYRAVALAFLRSGTDVSDEQAQHVLSSVHLDVEHHGSGMFVLLNGEDVTEALRQPEVGRMASRVSVLKEVRDQLVAQQRRIGYANAHSPGVVLDGRDIGTVVFPDADVKIFMVANPEERARRRHQELLTRGSTLTFEEVLDEIQTRDRQDTERTHAPLRQAEDALALDTTNQSIEEQVQFVIDRVREREKIGRV